MRRSGGYHIVAALALGLSSCNTTDALTPQADIGGGMGPSSSPVTQQDADRMAGSAGAERQAPSPSSGWHARPTGPQNTLEAQARALEAGSAVSPASSGPPPQWQDQTQTDDGQTEDGQQSGPSAGPITPAPAGGTAAMQAAGALGTVRFLPIIGAPVQAVTPLSRQLGASARAIGLTIRPSGDTTTDHILKGYFSAFADGGKVTIVYVWDVLDGTGGRLHRMQGQETVPSTGADPWSAVPASLMQSIASRTIEDYAGWQRARAQP